MTTIFVKAGGDYRIIALLFTDGVLNWLQNIIAFSVLSLVTPLTYAVASASKRIFVIAVSLFILGNPVTWMNMFGMLLAIIGVLCYNRVSINSVRNCTKRFLTTHTFPALNPKGKANKPHQEAVHPAHHILAQLLSQWQQLAQILTASERHELQQ